MKIIKCELIYKGENKMTNDVSKTIGVNINRIRTARHLTLKQLSVKLNKLGYDITPQQLSAIENGKTRPYADQIVYLASALECSFGNILTRPEVMDINSAVYNTITSAPEDVKEILFYILSDWTGNSTALWKFVGLYATLPPKIRSMISGMGIAVYNFAKYSKQLDSSAPPVDIAYIIKEYDKLDK